MEQVIIIGAGQAGLSTAYYLKRHGIDPLILDANASFGGSWVQAWDSLKLFSPKEYSSLSGYGMPTTIDEYPNRQEVIDYFGKYEQRYQFRIHRPVKVLDVKKLDGVYQIKTDKGDFGAQSLVSATGNFSGKVMPNFEGIEKFNGIQVHSSEYKNNTLFKGLNVAIIGSGNSGSQVLAEVSKVAKTHWFTNKPLQYLDDDLDGRYLFELSTKRYYAGLNNEVIGETDEFSKIVMTDSVKEARNRGVLKREENIQEFTKNSLITKNKNIPLDAIIWCTGFETKLDHLNGLNLKQDVKTLSDGPHSTDHTNLWYVGYGEWSGYASATIVGVQKHAKQTAKQITEYLHS